METLKKQFFTEPAETGQFLEIVECVVRGQEYVVMVQILKCISIIGVITDGTCSDVRISHSSYPTSTADQ